MKQPKVLKIIAHAKNMEKREDERGEKWFLTIEIQLTASARNKIAGRAQRDARKEQIQEKKRTQSSASA